MVLFDGMRRRWRWRTVLGVGALVLIYGTFVHTPAGPRSVRVFNPDRVADLEVGMWRAYYDKENVRLFGLLVLTLREQYRYTWAKAWTVGFYLARPAAQFAGMKQGYDAVLPDLTRAFAITKEWTSAGYDPAEVARAELAWWVARRDAGTNSVENVGALIAKLYAAFYEVPVGRVAEAGRLRAAAAALRDQGGRGADWPRVSDLLHQSYRDLERAVRMPGDKNVRRPPHNFSRQTNKDIDLHNAGALH